MRYCYGGLREQRHRRDEGYRLRKLAESTGNVGAAVQAEQLRGKVEGHYIEKHQDVGEVPEDQALLDAIETLLGDDIPNIRELAARKLGLDGPKVDH